MAKEKSPLACYQRPIRPARLCFLHGMDSSPEGTKAKLLKKTYPECRTPALPPDIYRRLEIVERDISHATVLVGSSLGGLTAVMYAMEHPEMVDGMVLMAPAVGCSDESILSGYKPLADSLYIPKGFQTVVIAGIHDTLIPLSAVYSLIARSPGKEAIRLHTVDDDHMLHRSLDLMLQEVENILRV